MHRPQGWLHLTVNLYNQGIEQTKCKKGLKKQGVKMWNTMPNEIEKPLFSKFKIMVDGQCSL